MEKYAKLTIFTVILYDVQGNALTSESVEFT
jgi:hypothetical protein